MTSAHLNRITTGALAALLAASIGVGLHQANRARTADQAAAAWRGEATAWRSVAEDTATQNAALATRYDRLVRRATANEQRLVQALAEGAPRPATMPIEALAAEPATQQAAPAVQPAPAAEPTTQAS